MENIVYGFIMILLVMAVIIYIAMYVLYGISHTKMLKFMGYNYPWMAWIPFLRWFAVADCLPEEDVEFMGMSIPLDIFRFWWALRLVLPYIPTIGGLLDAVLCVLCRGHCYTLIFAVTDRKDSEETKTMGFLAGAFPVIASFKYMFKEIR